ncbi:MAG: hypothetical protein ACJA1B_001957 [Polaribacter sp.]|jgi:hypothetical protein
MSTYADQTEENKSESVSSAVSQLQTSGAPTFEFMDSRPEAVAQRKLQHIADGSSQVSQLKSFQEMADNSFHAKQVAQLQAMADTYSAQQYQTIQRQENNTGLPDNLKSGMENLSGLSMDDVKVHRNSDKPAQLNAHAYAQGTDIHLGPGQEKHLPHELGHVVQQKEGRVKPTKQLKGKTNINDDKGLEKEADVLGNKALNYNENSAIQKKETINISTNVAQRDVGDDVDSTLDKKEKKSALNKAAGIAEIIDTSADRGVSNLADEAPTFKKGKKEFNAYTGEEESSEDDNTVTGMDAFAGGAKFVSGAGSVLGFAQAVKNLKDSDNKFDTVDAVLQGSSALLNMVGSAAGMADDLSTDDENQGADQVSDFAGGLMEGLDAIREFTSLMKTLWEIENGKKLNTIEKQEAIISTLNLARNAMASVKTFLDYYHSGTLEYSQAIPGIAIAINSIKGLMDFYNALEARKNINLLEIKLEAVANEQIINVDESVAELRGGSAKTKWKSFKEAFGFEKSEASEKRQFRKDALDSLRENLEDEEDEVIKIKLNKALNQIEEQTALHQLIEINKDKRNNALFNGAVNVLKVAGDIMNFIPGAQIAGTVLKTSGSGLKIGKSLAQKGRQMYREKGHGDQTQTKSAKNERNKETIKYIFKQTEKIENNEDKAVSNLISATGCNPEQIYSLADKDIIEAIKTINESLNK